MGCVREPSTVTLRGRGRTSVAGATVTVPVTRRRTSAVTLGSFVGTLTVPMSHFLFPCLEDGAVSIVRENLGVEKGKGVGEGRWAHRRLWSEEPQLQQRPLYCTHAWRRASSVRKGVHKDNLVWRSWFVTVQTIA